MLKKNANFKKGLFALDTTTCSDTTKKQGMIKSSQLREIRSWRNSRFMWMQSGMLANTNKN